MPEIKVPTQIKLDNLKVLYNQKLIRIRISD